MQQKKAFSIYERRHASGRVLSDALRGAVQKEGYGIGIRDFFAGLNPCVCETASGFKMFLVQE